MPHEFQKVESIEELVHFIGIPSELVIKKQLAQLDRHLRNFIEESPFLLLGTVDPSGKCDVSPRGDLPGKLAKVLDDTTILIPDRRGNRRADSLRNIVETGRVGLLFMIPGHGETLRVNGTAHVIKNPELLAEMAVDGKQPVLAIAVLVEECFLQCAKAIIRSKLWEVESQRTTQSRPCFGQILLDQTQIEGETVEGLQKRINESYQQNLY